MAENTLDDLTSVDNVKKDLTDMIANVDVTDVANPSDQPEGEKILCELPNDVQAMLKNFFNMKSVSQLESLKKKITGSGYNAEHPESSIPVIINGQSYKVNCRLHKYGHNTAGDYSSDDNSAIQIDIKNEKGEHIISLSKYLSENPSGPHANFGMFSIKNNIVFRAAEGGMFQGNGAISEIKKVPFPKKLTLNVADGNEEGDIINAVRAALK